MKTSDVLKVSAFFYKWWSCSATAATGHWTMIAVPGSTEFTSRPDTRTTRSKHYVCSPSSLCHTSGEKSGNEGPATAGHRELLGTGPGGSTHEPTRRELRSVGVWPQRDGEGPDTDEAVSLVYCAAHSRECVLGLPGRRQRKKGH